LTTILPSLSSIISRELAGVRSDGQNRSFGKTLATSWPFPSSITSRELAHRPASTLFVRKSQHKSPCLLRLGASTSSASDQYKLIHDAIPYKASYHNTHTRISKCTPSTPLSTRLCRTSPLRMTPLPRSNIRLRTPNLLTLPRNPPLRFRINMRFLPPLLRRRLPLRSILLQFFVTHHLQRFLMRSVQMYFGDVLVG